MKSRRSPRTLYQQPLLQDQPPPPPPPVPSTPSSYRPRSPSSSSAASASSVASVIHSTPTSSSKMPLRTPTSHTSPGYQGYFDPYTVQSQQSQQQQQQQQQPQHPPPQPPPPPPPLVPTTAQIVAAQAAMQAASSNRKRSTTGPSPNSPPQASSAAGAAANAAMPRSAIEKQWELANSSTATLTGRDQSGTATSGTSSSNSNGNSNSNNNNIPTTTIPSYRANLNTSPTATKKESSSKMNKLFSGRIGTPSLDKGQKPPPSPSKISHSIISNPIPRLGSHVHSSDRKGSFSSSTVTLVGAATATATDIFAYAPPQAPYTSNTPYSSSPPTSSSTKEHKEHKEHSHSRSHFLRVRKDVNTVALSSASSNSKPISADGSSIYSFIPSSPSASVFDKAHSKSGNASETKYGSIGKGGDHDFMATGVDDWAFVRRNVGALFEGELLRTPVEDMNKHVTNHIRRCYERKRPDVLIQDVYDILDAGMLSLDPMLSSYPDDKLVPRLVEIWQFVFSQILPYFEAVFLPLQQEFKGVGQVLTTPREARDFWLEVVERENGGISTNAFLGSSIAAGLASLNGGGSAGEGRNGGGSISSGVDGGRSGNGVGIGTAISINTSNLPPATISHPTSTTSLTHSGDATPTSLIGPSPSATANIISASTTTLNALNTMPTNTSATTTTTTTSSASQNQTPHLLILPPLSHTFDHRALDTRRMALISFRENVILPLFGKLRIVFSRLQMDFSSDLQNSTQSVARVLQCVSVLASILSKDESQAKMDELAKTLKHNWLSRGRAGRNRRGFVGTKTRALGMI